MRYTRFFLLLILLITIASIVLTYASSRMINNSPTISQKGSNGAMQPNQRQSIIKSAFVEKTEQQASQKVKVISLRLTRQGFEPAEVTSPAGAYFLTIQNSTELNVVELKLSREAGPRLRTARISKENLRWRDRVELTPGRYMLTESNHPNWVCQIRIIAP